MAIANGQAITKADLDALITAALASIQTDNAQLPLAFQVNHTFFNVLPGTNANNRKFVFVAPFDMYLESAGVNAGDQTNLSVVTLDITGDGALKNWPTRATVTCGAPPAANIGARLLYDNTKTPPGSDFKSKSRAFRVFSKGSTITVSIAITVNAVAASMVQVILAFRQFFGRE